MICVELEESRAVCASKKQREKHKNHENDSHNTSANLRRRKAPGRWPFVLKNVPPATGACRCIDPEAPAHYVFVSCFLWILNDCIPGCLRTCDLALGDVFLSGKTLKKLVSKLLFPIFKPCFGFFQQHPLP